VAIRSIRGGGGGVYGLKGGNEVDRANGFIVAWFKGGFTGDIHIRGVVLWILLPTKLAGGGGVDNHRVPRGPR